MSDLFGNHIVGFPTRRLIYNRMRTVFFSCTKNVPESISFSFSRGILAVYGHYPTTSCMRGDGVRGPTGVTVRD